MVRRAANSIRPSFHTCPVSPSASSAPVDGSWADYGVGGAVALVRTRMRQQDCARCCITRRRCCHCSGDTWLVQAIKDESGAIKPPRLTASRPEKRLHRGCVMRATGNKCLAGTDPTAFCRHGDEPIYFPPLPQHKKGGQGRARRAINRARSAPVTQPGSAGSRW